jgi:uncharacterized protein with PQ loop repeat
LRKLQGGFITGLGISVGKIGIQKNGSENIENGKKQMEDNVRFLNQIDKMLKQKQNDYGSFDTTSWLMTGILERILSAHNGVTVKVPNRIFGIFMIILKLWRVLNRKKYHKDDNDDVNGYNELLRKLVQNEDKANEK